MMTNLRAARGDVPGGTDPNAHIGIESRAMTTRDARCLRWMNCPVGTSRPRLDGETLRIRVILDAVPGER
ncbi:hypothetical protein GCM10010168_02150 [Actinoplanes ianthinogenes]|uniref:Uncharacterized protein n=1 Tax=Actinoplanes ianthinogenes TaxID=122358 RepID=A0ABM7LUP5_9ACTN|nr:hypothetical protein Aiant_36990 [Actinoplanes ianthinogenes]GGQ90564.1 hypothetical protein GCM10010168_02150 [Actinoplanes ianthinogenes]